MTSIFSFSFALVAIVGMIAFKNWEIKEGRTILHKARFNADRVVASWFTFVRSHLPTRGRKLSKEITHHAAFHFSHFALSGVKLMERKLIRVINFIKGKGVVKKDRTTSHYMKNVSEFERHPDRK
jgi:hypothetical protein